MNIFSKFLNVEIARYYLQMLKFSFQQKKLQISGRITRNQGI